MTQRLHVNVNSGRIRSGSALGEEKNNTYTILTKLDQRSAAQKKKTMMKKLKRGFSASLYESDLQADGQVDPGAKGGADSTWR